jgi:hypothetical protein
LTVGVTPATSSVASETPSFEFPLTEVARFEYHNGLKAKLLMVAITEATTDEWQTLSRNAFGPAKTKPSSGSK